MTLKTKRILFIDDNEAITELAQELLKYIGYESEVSKTSISAIELLKSQPDDFDLVITDMNMPILNGIELSKAMLTIRPDLPIILCSGDSEDFAKDLAFKIGIKDYLHKPFTMKELQTAVNQVLA